MTTAITTQEQKNITNKVDTQALNGMGLSMSDFRPTYLAVQQKMSKAVDQGICKPGDIIETSINNIVGGEGKPVEIFPIFMRKEWCSYYKDTKDLKPFRKEAYGPLNAHWKYNEVQEGREVKNDLVTIWYVLPAIEGALPSIVSFRGNSGRAGNNLSQMVIRQIAAGKPGFSKAIKLESVKESNEKGTFYVFKTSMGRDATGTELASCHMWEKMFNSSPAPVVEEEGEAVPF